MDHFKSINDRYGHPGGDQALIEIASRLRQATRPGDVLARYDGEEFAVLVLGTAPDELWLLSERLRHQVASTPITVTSGTEVLITVSIGAVSYPLHGENPSELVATADRALYRAKAHGRNRVVIGQSIQPMPTQLAMVANEARTINS